MPETYVVQQGDCFAKLALEHGFADGQALYDLQSEAFKQKRPDLHALLPGDEVTLPDKQDKKEPCVTERRHRFVLQRPRTRLRLRLHDEGGPHGGRAYELTVGDEVIEGTTDPEGWLDEQVPHGATVGELRLWVEDGQPPVPLRLEIGFLDPLEETSGVQGRLRALGYTCAVTGALDDGTRAALRAFQEERGLSVTGEVDAATREELRAAHSGQD